jgi:hypothetical protein
MVAHGPEHAGAGVDLSGFFRFVRTFSGLLTLGYGWW